MDYWKQNLNFLRRQDGQQQLADFMVGAKTTAEKILSRRDREHHLDLECAEVINKYFVGYFTSGRMACWQAPYVKVWILEIQDMMRQIDSRHQQLVSDETGDDYRLWNGRLVAVSDKEGRMLDCIGDRDEVSIVEFVQEVWGEQYENVNHNKYHQRVHVLNDKLLKAGVRSGVHLDRLGGCVVVDHP